MLLGEESNKIYLKKSLYNITIPLINNIALQLGSKIILFFHSLQIPYNVRSDEIQYSKMYDERIR